MTVAGKEEIPKTQRAAVSDDASGFEIKEIPVTQPDQLEPGRALVKVLYSGVCHVSANLPDALASTDDSGRWAEDGSAAPPRVDLACAGPVLPPHTRIWR